VELPPVSSDNSGLVAEIERELGLAGDDTVLGPLIAQDIEAFAAGQKAVSSTPPPGMYRRAPIPSRCSAVNFNRTLPISRSSAQE